MIEELFLKIKNFNLWFCKSGNSCFHFLKNNTCEIFDDNKKIFQSNLEKN